MLYNPVLLFRSSTSQLIQHISSQLSPSSSYKLLLSGKSGAGKSSTVVLLTSHFHEKGYLTLYIPRPWEWISGWKPYVPIHDSSLSSSDSNSAASISYEQKEVAQLLCWNFLKMNESIFKQISLSDKFQSLFQNLPKGTSSSGSKPSSKEGSSSSQVNLLDAKFSNPIFPRLKIVSNPQNLLELMSHGCLSSSLSHDILTLFFKVLNVPDTLRPPLFIGLDQVNGLYSKTEYHNVKSLVIESQELRLSKEFGQLLSDKGPLGLMVRNEIIFQSQMILLSFQ